MPGSSATGDEQRCQVLTIGHSTRPIEAFVGLLVAHGVTQLVDVRTVPRSRHNPQFNAKTLPASLADVGIGYVHANGLGGFRRTSPLSENGGWRNVSFRGYADHMQTTDFDADLTGLIELAQDERVVVMCAEAVPWRCHRSLIADALWVRGMTTCEIVGKTRLQLHKMTPFARVDGHRITYPPAPVVGPDSPSNPTTGQTMTSKPADAKGDALADVPPLANAELVQLQIRVIALENLVIAMLSDAPARQLDLVRGKAKHILPRPGFTPHRLTIAAATEMNSLVERAIRFSAEPSSSRD